MIKDEDGSLDEMFLYNKIIYILLSLANNKTGISVERSIIKPPIVGVPCFSFCPESPKSLIDSPICFILRKLIIFLPKIVEISKDVITAAAALKEIYVNKEAPGIWY